MYVVVRFSSEHDVGCWLFFLLRHGHLLHTILFSLRVKKVLYCVPPSHSPDSLPSLWLSPFLGRFSARGCSSAVTRAFLKYAFRSLFVIDDVSGSGAVDGAGTGSVSVAVLSVSCAPGTRNLWPPVPSARARARASERRL